MTGNASTASPNAKFQSVAVTYGSAPSMPPENYPSSFPFFCSPADPRPSALEMTGPGLMCPPPYPVPYPHYQMPFEHLMMPDVSLHSGAPSHSATDHQIFAQNRPIEQSEESWGSHGDGLQSSSQTAISDPCARVVQVLQCYHQGGEQPDFVRKAIESLVKKLKDKRTELDALISAITSGGKEQTSCVTIQRSLDGRLQVAGRKGVPHVVYARIWRWPNVSKNELQKMDICVIPHDHPDLICINPFHYERVVSSGYGNLDMNAVNQRQPSGSMDFKNTLAHSNSMDVDGGTPKLLPNVGGPAPVCYPQTYGEQEFAPEVSMRPMGETTSLQSGYPMSNGPDGNSLCPSYNNVASMQSQTFFMYGPTQQPTCVVTHDVGDRQSMQNNNLPTFSSDFFENDWRHQNEGGYYVSPERRPVMERYNRLRYMMQSVSVPQILHQVAGLSDWCSISYYELDTQIGETINVPIEKRRIVIDGGMDPNSARSGRYCLGAFSNVHRTEASERARMGIGRGIELVYEETGVVLECLSEKGIFVRSNYMDFESNVIYGSTVHKFTSGAKRKVFDLQWAYMEMYDQRESAQKAFEQQAHAIAGSVPTAGVLDRSVIGVDDLRRVCCTIAISFVKGWGSHYNRPSLKDTPCWIELQLHRPLQLLNNILQKA